jgi:hypothetical protein
LDTRIDEATSATVKKRTSPKGLSGLEAIFDASFFTRFKAFPKP